jgi:Cupin domain
VAQFNGHDVMVVKAKGEFGWHSHPDTDDFFLVLAGSLVIQLRDGEVRLGPGDLYVVPRGVEHRPVTVDEVHLLLIEPQGTPNTGDPAPPRSSRRSRRSREAGGRLFRLDSVVALSQRAWRLAGGPGFEPGLLGPEPRVLPLNYPPTATDEG